jgi:hypothetical protein
MGHCNLEISELLSKRLLPLIFKLNEDGCVLL